VQITALLTVARDVEVQQQGHSNCQHVFLAACGAEIYPQELAWQPDFSSEDSFAGMIDIRERKMVTAKIEGKPHTFRRMSLN
jgi:hypothetical protein